MTRCGTEPFTAWNPDFRLRGGKRGFGSVFGALGAQVEKTTNPEACWDLSGRRRGGASHGKAMAEWVKRAEREAGKEQKRLERLQRELTDPRRGLPTPAASSRAPKWLSWRSRPSRSAGHPQRDGVTEIGETLKQPNKSETQGPEPCKGDREEAPSPARVRSPAPKVTVRPWRRQPNFPVALRGQER